MQFIKNFNFHENLNSNNTHVQENNPPESNAENPNNQEEYSWYIKIPKTNLIAPIKETINMDILNEYIGHFEETPDKEGNIGLAGHNRGYKKNYFENIHTLKIGDEIFYKKDNFEKTYVIDTIETIKNTNWSYLENTNENKITLITCIENKPELRLCIQATEK